VPDTIRYLPSPTLANDALNELFHNAWKDHAPVDFSYLPTHSLGWIGAFAGERLVGFVNVAWDGGKHAFVLDTTVHRDYQRQGIGRALVEHALALARAKGVEWVHVDFEPGLEPFYRACGFRATAAGVLRGQSPRWGGSGEA